MKSQHFFSTTKILLSMVSLSVRMVFTLSGRRSEKDRVKAAENEYKSTWNERLSDMTGRQNRDVKWLKAFCSLILFETENRNKKKTNELMNLKAKLLIIICMLFLFCWQVSLKSLLRHQKKQKFLINLIFFSSLSFLCLNSHLDVLPFFIWLNLNWFRKFIDFDSLTSRSEKNFLRRNAEGNWKF